MARNADDRKSGITLIVALISDTFFGAGGEKHLREALKEAKSQGASLALLPELPLNTWSPATREAHAQDAEPPKGKRHQIQAAAAGAVGIGLIGGAIVKDPRTGERYNTALVFDATGAHLGSYRKCHIPDEPGFHETSHYVAGDEPSEVFDAFGLRFGIQICSDINRPQGTLALAAAGAEAIFNPRASELATVDRWRIVFQAVAVTSGAYVVSVNRPRSEGDVAIGGNSIVASPRGAVVLETTERIAVANLERRIVEQARSEYPGDLPIKADLYARAWSKIKPVPGRTT